jgi:hypothetical protein
MKVGKHLTLDAEVEADLFAHWDRESVPRRYLRASAWLRLARQYQKEGASPSDPRLTEALNQVQRLRTEIAAFRSIRADRVAASLRKTYPTVAYSKRRA